MSRGSFLICLTLAYTPNTSTHPTLPQTQHYPRPKQVCVTPFPSFCLVSHQLIRTLHTNAHLLSLLSILHTLSCEPADVCVCACKRAVRCGAGQRNGDLAGRGRGDKFGSGSAWGSVVLGAGASGSGFAGLGAGAGVRAALVGRGNLLGRWGGVGGWMVAPALPLPCRLTWAASAAPWLGWGSRHGRT